MDEDKIDRTIGIILQQQAQFYADMQKMQEAQNELRESQIRSEKRVDTLQEVAVTLLDTAKTTNESINQLSTKLDEFAVETREQSKETNERLNAVIYMAEKYFFDKQNGNSD